MPINWCAHIDARETEDSKKGQHDTAANGGKIFNEGEKMARMMSKEGMLMNMRFAACKVERALGSVSAICKQGHTIVFNGPEHPDGSYIQNLSTGEKIHLQHKDGVFVLDTRVAPKDKQPFTGQGR